MLEMATLSEAEAEKLIMHILDEAEDPLTTAEIKSKVKGSGNECADGLPRVLSKMKYKGLISGKLSLERKEWVWWKT